MNTLVELKVKNLNKIFLFLKNCIKIKENSGNLNCDQLIMRYIKKSNPRRV